MNDGREVFGTSLPPGVTDRDTDGPQLSRAQQYEADCEHVRVNDLHDLNKADPEVAADVAAAVLLKAISAGRAVEMVEALRYCDPIGDTVKTEADAVAAKFGGYTAEPWGGLRDWDKGAWEAGNKAIPSNWAEHVQGLRAREELRSLKPQLLKLSVATDVVDEMSGPFAARWNTVDDYRKHAGEVSDARHCAEVAAGVLRTSVNQVNWMMLGL